MLYRYIRNFFLTVLGVIYVAVFILTVIIIMFGDQLYE